MNILLRSMAALAMVFVSLITSTFSDTSNTLVSAFPTPNKKSVMLSSARASFYSSTATTQRTSRSLNMSTSGNVRNDSADAQEKGRKPFSRGNRGKVLILGGSGFLGGTIAKRALLEGYSITSLSRRGKPDTVDSTSGVEDSIDYRIGDARQLSDIESILNDDDDDVDDDDYVAIIHCVGLLFDGNSGLGNFNRLVSGSGSIPDENSTYDDITRLTAFNAIEAAENYVTRKKMEKPLPFLFTSAAEAGWPDVRGGKLIERTVAPGWLKRYLVAKRAVEARLMKNQNLLRPVIFRPSLIYSVDRLTSLPPVGAFFVGNKLGLPFVDRPVTVQKLSNAAVRSIMKDDVSGVQRFMQIDELNK